MPKRPQCHVNPRALLKHVPAHLQAIQRLRSSSRWQRLRRWLLTKEPLCRECNKKGVTTVASEIHHVKPVRQGIELFFVESNLMPCCRPCHEELEKLHNWIGGLPNEI